jgi:DDE superfamily endonuclease
MVSSYSEQEDRIKKACSTYHKNPSRKITELAKEFDVPYHALRNRLNGKPSRIDVGGKNKKLSEHQELAIIRFVKVLEGFGIEPRPRFLRGIANRILKADHSNPTTPPPTVGLLWSRRFIERRPELHMQKASPLPAEHKRTHDSESIQDWFLRPKKIMDVYGVVANDIYNMDETGYRTGCGRSHLIITTRPEKRKFLLDPDNRQHITSMECVSASGYVLPSTIILPGVQMTHNWILSELDPSTVLAVSDTGYSNDEIQLNWIKHFNKHTKSRTIGAKRLLLLDGVNSHMEYDFIEYCWDENIIPFTFIPHTTHLCQPLDVKCFQPLKHYHSEAIDNAVRTGDSDFSKIEFSCYISNLSRTSFYNIHDTLRLPRNRYHALGSSEGPQQVITASDPSFRSRAFSPSTKYPRDVKAHLLLLKN